MSDTIVPDARSPGIAARGIAVHARALLAAWALAVLAIGGAMLAAWVGQRLGTGTPGDIYVPVWERLALLATIATCPPCLAWASWRLGARMTGAAPARSH